jgi:uncharacterized protein (DUF1800 family)
MPLLPATPERDTANQVRRTPTPQPTATRPPPTATATAVPPTATPVPTATPSGQPAQQPLEIMVFSRLAYGPRPGDLDAFRALPGNTPDEKLYAWLDLQLNPERIDDSDCNTRLLAHALPTQQVIDSIATMASAPAIEVMGKYKAYMPIASRENVARRLDTDQMPAAPAAPALPAVPAEADLLKTHFHNYWRRPMRTKEFDTFRVFWDVRVSTVLRAVYSKRQLFEVMADFWHNHFNIFASEGYPVVAWQHFDSYVIRKHALGNFRALLEAVTKSPAMLYYLDNYINTRGGPNENWARELFELHTLGAEHYAGIKPQADVPGYPTAPTQYVDEDVYEATRCFTGWTFNAAYGTDADPATWGDLGFVYKDELHDRFQKRVLGVDIAPDGAPMADGKRVLDILCAHPGTARFIARKLCTRLIGESVDERTIEFVADTFRALKDDPNQIARTIRAITNTHAFRTVWADKIKRPWEVYVSALRATNAQLNLKPELKPNANNEMTWIDRYEFFGYFDQMGQGMFVKPSPDGYPDKRGAWSSTTPMVMRWRTMWWICEAGTQANRAEITVDILTQTAAIAVKTAPNIVDFWIDRILGRPVAPETRQTLIEFLGQGNVTQPLNLESANTQRIVQLTVSLLLSSPDFNWR